MSCVVERVISYPWPVLFPTTLYLKMIAPIVSAEEHSGLFATFHKLSIPLVQQFTLIGHLSVCPSESDFNCGIWLSSCGAIEHVHWSWLTSSLAPS